MNNETRIQREVRLALNRTMRVRVIRNNVGAARTKDGGFIRYGLNVGSADLVGMMKGGRAFACEVKTASGRLSNEQRLWMDAFRRWGGFACVARSAEEALAALTRAEKGEAE